MVIAEETEVQVDVVVGVSVQFDYGGGCDEAIANPSSKEYALLAQSFITYVSITAVV